MPIQITTAKTKTELIEILQLQEKNHRMHLSKEEMQANGFLSVKHDLHVLEAMNQAAPQIIAKADGKVVGFAMVMLESFKDSVQELRPLFDTLLQVEYMGKKITDHRYYVMGQVCVDEDFRSRGIFDLLYAKHKEVYGTQYEICVTEIASGNRRSMNAHQRVGFEVVYTFEDPTDEWNVVVWNWK